MIIINLPVNGYNFSHEKTFLTIDGDGNVHLTFNVEKTYDENIRAITIGLINFCLDQKSRGFTSFSINKTFEIDVTSTKIRYTGDKFSQEMSDIIALFNKYTELKVFW